MRNLQSLQPLPTAATGEVIGRGRPDALPARPVLPVVPPVAANEPLVDGHDGWARHAAAANGFGDAIVDEGDSRSDTTPGTPSRLEPPAPGDGRPPGSVAALAAAFRGLVTAWCRRRIARATEVALHELDDRSLRDLGLDPGEIRSIAGELAGLADATRAHTLHALGHRML